MNYADLMPSHYDPALIIAASLEELYLQDEWPLEESFNSADMQRSKFDFEQDISASS
ncbi:MAG: hypothetical protein HRU20_01265 [Pseudomonadales bacterium]|nr:hypothetical protein [Pseudomonadales bacterium]